MKCLYCEQEFTIKPTGKSGGQNRQFCYNCLPEGLDHNARIARSRELIRLKALQEKETLGCSICGYNKNGAALEWHHLDPDAKEDEPSNLSKLGTWSGWQQYQEEIKKCILVCANCHREIHNPKLTYTTMEGTDENEQFRQLVLQTYQQTNSVYQTHKILNKDIRSIRNILTYYNIDYNKSPKMTVNMLDKDTNEVLQSFINTAEASIYVIGTSAGTSHISSVCNGKRQTAYGYKWEYIK